MWKWTELKFYFLVLIVKFTLYIEIDHSSPSPVYPTIAIVFYAPSSLSFAFCALATNSSTQVPPWSTLDLNFLPIAVCFCFSLSFPPPTVLFFCRKTVNTQSRHSLLQIKKVTLVLIRERFDCNFNVVPSSSIVNTAGGWRPVTNEIFRRTQQLPLADSLCLSLSLSLFHFIHFFYFFYTLSYPHTFVPHPIQPGKLSLILSRTSRLLFHSPSHLVLSHTRRIFPDIPLIKVTATLVHRPKQRPFDALYR